jgi:hypothetical protein
MIKPALASALAADSAADSGVPAPKKKHKMKFPGVALLELAVGAYCIFGLFEYIDARVFLIGPFLALYAIGFLSVGVLSIAHFMGANRQEV